jgi:putative N6-adenine-specific DNA methylase
MHRFFLVVPPGFEALAEAELLVWLQSISFELQTPVLREKGGLSLDLPLEIGFALNGRVKIPSRILLRLADFGCRDFPKLFKKMRGLDWLPWVFQGCATPEFVASSHASRLALKKRIQSTCEDGFKAWQKLQGISVSPTDERLADERPTVMVRFFDDVCTVSIDTSGEHLHKRGYKTKTTDAPLRENIAAALLLMILPKDRETTLIDPMVGSGTFLTEALLLSKFVARDFAFQKFACVRDGKVEVRNIVDSSANFPRIQRALGFDNSDDAIKAATSNIETAKLKKAVELKKADLFEATYDVSEEVSKGYRVVVCNPPYGERLKVQGSLANLYSKLLHVIDQKLKPHKVGVLLPAKSNPRTLRLPEGWQAEATLPFENGGLPVVFYSFTCASLKR